MTRQVVGVRDGFGLQAEGPMWSHHCMLCLPGLVETVIL